MENKKNKLHQKLKKQKILSISKKTWNFGCKFYLTSFDYNIMDCFHKELYSPRSKKQTWIRPRTKNNRAEPGWPLDEVERTGKLQRVFPGEERWTTCPCSESNSSAQALEPKAVTAHCHPKTCLSYLPWDTSMGKDKLGV